MAGIITRNTENGKSVKILLNNLTDQDNSKLKEALSEELYCVLELKEERKTSNHILIYGLHRIYIDEEHLPESGWGNSITGTDIGDDVERLYRIQTIVREIPNPVTVSVESYIRLLDIMKKHTAGS